MDMYIRMDIMMNIGLLPVVGINAKTIIVTQLILQTPILSESGASV